MNAPRWLTAAVLSAAAVMAPALAASPAGAATCTQTSATGNCGPYSDPNVYGDVNGSDLVAQDVWNTPPNWNGTVNPCAGTPSCQTLSANGPGDWTVAANYGNPGDEGSVKSYPDTQVTYTLTNGTTPPMSNFGTTLSSSWGNINPTGSGLIYEYAYDIWTNPAGNASWGSPQDEETMIWTDNHGQTPAGTDTGNVYTDAAGTNWEVWTDTGGSSTSNTYAIISFVRASNAASGSLDLMGFFNYEKSHGYMNSNAGIDQIGYGPELCSTAGQLKTFGLTSYTLVKNGSGGGGGTAPVVTTDAASSVTSSGATLNGTVNPEGAATTYQFDYGTTTSYGTSVPVPAGPAGSGSTAVSENAPVTGLSAGTTYHYRIEATNATGTTFGSDQTFTTSAGGGGSTVAFDAKIGGKKTGTTPLSITLPVGAGSNRAMLIEATVGVPANPGDTGCTQSIKVNGVSLTTAANRLAVVHTNNMHSGFMDVWAILNPASGSNVVQMSVSGCSSPALTMVAQSFTGVDQSVDASGKPTGLPLVTAFGSGATASATITPASAQDMVAAFAAAGNSLGTPPSPAVNVLLENQNASSGAGNSGGATAPGSASAVTINWPLASDWWAEGLVDLHHA